MKTISVFIGMKKGKSNKGIYSLTLYMEGRILNLPEKDFVLTNLKTETDIAMDALNDLLLQMEALGERKLNVRLYLGTGALLGNIKCSEINSVLQRTDSTLEIIIDSPLAALNDIKSRKLKRAK